MYNFSNLINLIKSAREFDVKNNFDSSDALLKVVLSQTGLDTDKEISEFEKDKVNPISRIYSDYGSFSQMKGVPGSGTFSAPDDILQKIDGIPSRFKDMTVDQFSREINSSIPPFNPAVHQTKYNYLFEFVPKFVEERLDFFSDAKIAVSLLKRYLFSDIFKKQFLNGEDDEEIMEGLSSLFDHINLSEELNQAFQNI